MRAVTDLTTAFVLVVPHEEATKIRDDAGFIQSARAVLTKAVNQQSRPEQELDAAIGICRGFHFTQHASGALRS